jgi:hypothetical protein
MVSPDSESSVEPAEPGCGSSPGEGGETVAGVEPETVVFAPPDAETVLGEPDPVGEPPAGAEPPDADGAVDGSVFDELVCVVVSEAESLEPVVSARAISGVEAIAAPTPRATASAPTRPTYRA